MEAHQKYFEVFMSNTFYDTIYYQTYVQVTYLPL